MRVLSMDELLAVSGGGHKKSGCGGKGKGHGKGKGKGHGKGKGKGHGKGKGKGHGKGKGCGCPPAGKGTGMHGLRGRRR